VKVQADVFPAVVALAEPDSMKDIRELMPKGAAPKGTRRLDRCRVAVFNDQVLIAVDSPSGPNLVFKEAITFYEKFEKIHRVITETGKLIAFKKDDNCGCGSRLRSWSPYGSTLVAQGDN
jgi:hypothetical protein